jgi:hypothetical protein
MNTSLCDQVLGAMFNEISTFGEPSDELDVAASAAALWLSGYLQVRTIRRTMGLRTDPGDEYMPIINEIKNRICLVMQDIVPELKNKVARLIAEEIAISRLTDMDTNGVN